MTEEELVAELKAVGKAAAARLLRQAHGYTCIWHDDLEDSCNTIKELGETFEMNDGDIIQGRYALGFEPFWLTRRTTKDGTIYWEAWKSLEAAQTSVAVAKQDGEEAPPHA